MTRRWQDKILINKMRNVDLPYFDESPAIKPPSIKLKNSTQWIYNYLVYNYNLLIFLLG